MEKKSFNEVLKEKEAAEAKQNAGANHEMTLDDAARVKVLSPGRLVFKRFIRNKLAIVGTAILAFMFLFAFVGPLFYPYGQKDVFKKYEGLQKTFATAQERTEYATFTYDSSIEIPSRVRNSINSEISKMEAQELRQEVIADDGVSYLLEKEGDYVYTLSTVGDAEVYVTFAAPAVAANYIKSVVPAPGVELSKQATDAIAAAIESGETAVSVGDDEFLIVSDNKKSVVYSVKGSNFNFTDAAADAEFEAAAINAVLAEQSVFVYNGNVYTLSQTDSGYSASTVAPQDTAYVYSLYSFDTYDASQPSDRFKVEALYHAYGEPDFTVDGVNYTVAHEDDQTVVYNADNMSEPYAMFTTFIVRDQLGNDSYDLAFKTAAQEQILAMQEQKLKTATYTYSLPAQQAEVEETTNEETGEVTSHEVITYITDENGNVQYEDKTITVELDLDQRYNLRWEQLTHQVDRYSGPTSDHVFGTDGDGMDLLARMMYGGRVSLIVGFVVVFLETILGVIMGGIAGYFGGWVDNLIMRLVDVFYCIPSTPILIILGSMMDKLKVDPYVRLFYLMAILGILGWAGIARLVRGQILSLREQEFMVATEATGVKVSKRIFRHLLPNVMPQLIVNMTASLGGVILTESTLSFLGLGVRHPLATWGTMINSVTATNEDMIRYTYIWIPVGLLICLTVIAFNFVGDGLRDAFDPKMKR